VIIMNQKRKRWTPKPIPVEVVIPSFGIPEKRDKMKTNEEVIVEEIISLGEEVRLEDILNKEEKILRQIVKDFARIKSNLLKYTSLVSKEYDSQLDNLVSESGEEVGFDEDKIYQIMSMIDDVSLDLKRIHREKRQEKDKDTEYRDEDLEKDTIYRVKK